VEPYGLSKNTIKAVNEVVSMGVPVSNVIVGQTRIKDNKSGQLTETKERGMGIIEGATITPDSYNHFGAIKFVSKFLK
jgi:hypothetical protein